MAASDDHTVDLADDILLHIFSLLPIKSITRTRAVCKRWNSLFQRIQLQATTLDFGDEFASGRSALELTVSVCWTFLLHGCKKLKGFKLTFDAFTIPMFVLENWLQCLREKNIEEIELCFCVAYGPLKRGESYGRREKFMLPSCLFRCKTLTCFKLSHSGFRLPTRFSGFSCLTELHLFDVRITEEMLDIMLITCPSLEMLYLRECCELIYVCICGENLRLRVLSVMDMLYMRELEVNAPKLRTFQFKGVSEEFNIINPDSLVEVIIFCLHGLVDFSPLEVNGCALWVNFLSKLANVEILTVCTSAIILLDECGVEGCDREPIIFGKVNELQLLLDNEWHHVLAKLCNFFRDCAFPSLEKLFIELSVYGSLRKRKIPKLDNHPNLLFDNLRMVKINNFHGYRYETLLVKFLLQKAVALEFMVLVAADLDEAANSSGSHQRRLKPAFEEVLLFPKA